MIQGPDSGCPQVVLLRNCLSWQEHPVILGDTGSEWMVAASSPSLGFPPIVHLQDRTDYAAE